jgi:hypothetical protein
MFSGVAASSYVLGGQDDRVGAVLDVDELADGLAGAPDLDARGAGHLGLDPLAHQRGDDVRALGIVRVARAVQVRQDQVDRVQAVLALVRLRLHGHHLLGQAVVDDAGVAGPAQRSSSFRSPSR